MESQKDELEQIVDCSPTGYEIMQDGEATNELTEWEANRGRCPQGDPWNEGRELESYPSRSNVAPCRV